MFGKKWTAHIDRGGGSFDHSILKENEEIIVINIENSNEMLMYGIDPSYCSLTSGR